MLPVEGGRIEAWTFMAHEGGVDDVDFSPDGRTLMTSGDQDLAIELWETGGAHRATLDGVGFRGEGRSWISAVFSPDGRTVATLGRQFSLWDVGSGAHRPVSDDENAAGSSAVFSQDGETVTTVGRGARIWDVGSGRLRTLLVTEDDRVSLAYVGTNGIAVARSGVSSDMAIPARPPSLEILDATTNRVARLDVRGMQVSWLSLVSSTDGTRLAASSWVHRVHAAASKSTVRVWSTTTLEPILSFDSPEMIEQLMLSPDGSLLLTVDMRGEVALRDVAASRLRYTLPAQESGFALSPDWSLLATRHSTYSASGWMPSVKLWRLASGEQIATIPLRLHEFEFESASAHAPLAFSPDGKLLAAGLEDGHVVVMGVGQLVR